MKEYTITLSGHKYTCFLDKLTYNTKYANSKKNIVALQLIDCTDQIPISTATINVPNEPLEEGEVIIKNYSENEGMYNELVRVGIISTFVRMVKLNYCDVPVCKLLV